jgi:drug/metabolite transporter (DMT)-like permease
MKPPSTPLGILAVITTAALWGSNHVVARAAHEAVPLPSLVFWRWFPAATILTLVAWPALRLAWPAIRPRLGELVIGGVVGIGLFSYLLLGAAYQSLAIEVGFLNATTPIFVLLLGPRVDGEPLATATKCGVALAFAGTLLIISKGELAALTGFHFSLGNFWALLSAIAFAWFSIRARDWTRDIPPLPLTVVTAWSGIIVVMLPVYLIWIGSGQPWLVWSDADFRFAVIAIAYVGLVPTMMGNLLFLYGVTILGAARAAAFIYLTPLFSAALSIGWLGEQPAWYHFAGFAAILSGLIMLGKSGPKPSAGSPAIE